MIPLVSLPLFSKAYRALPAELWAGLTPVAPPPIPPSSILSHVAKLYPLLVGSCNGVVRRMPAESVAKSKKADGPP